MVPLGGGRWLKELVLPPGTYEYRLIADGEWITDPLVKETAPNPFGGLNSVLKVPAPSEVTHEKLPSRSHHRGHPK
jgi:AMP-activated protein kinase-like protein